MTHEHRLTSLNSANAYEMPNGRIGGSDQGPVFDLSSWMFYKREEAGASLNWPTENY